MTDGLPDDVRAVPGFPRLAVSRSGDLWSRASGHWARASGMDRFATELARKAWPRQEERSSWAEGWLDGVRELPIVDRPFGTDQGKAARRSGRRRP
jgi:hypothetical protein